MNFEKIEDIVNIFMKDENIFNNLKFWFQRIMNQKYEYIVFPTRQSYMFALAMEKINGIQLEKITNAKICTEQSFYLNIDEIIEYYRKNKHFPSIVIAEPIGQYRIEINEMLKELETRVLEKLSSEEKEKLIMQFLELYPSYSEEEALKHIQLNLLTDVVTIQEFCVINQDLLFEAYKRNEIIYDMTLEKSKKMDLNIDIDKIIQNLDIANHTFSISECISREKLNSLKEQLLKDGFDSSVSELNHFYSQVKVLNNKNNIHTIYGVYIVESGLYETYRVIPYVFLPTISQQDVEVMINEISNKFDSKISNWIRLIKSSNISSLYELILFILNTALLKDFNKKYNLDINISSETWINEIHKLTRNYNITDFKETGEMISNIIISDQLDLDFFINLLSNTDSYIMTGFNNSNFNDLKLAELKKLKKSLEDYAYNYGLDINKRWVSLCRLNYIPSHELLESSYMNIDDVFSQCLKDSTIEELKKKISIILSFLDKGIFDVTLNKCHLNRNNTDLRQYVKYDNQLMLIKPLRYLEYIPMLAFLQKRCIQWGWDFDVCLDKFSESEFCTIDKDIILDVRTLFNKLSEIDCSFEDYDINYLMLLDIIPTENFTKIMEIRENINKYTKEFGNYMKKLGY